MIGDEYHVWPGDLHGSGQHPLGAKGLYRHAGGHRADVAAGHQLIRAEPAAVRVAQDDEIDRCAAELAQQLVGVPADAVVAVLHDPAVDQDAQRAGNRSAPSAPVAHESSLFLTTGQPGKRDLSARNGPGPRE